MDKIIERVRKLLALANDKGATEAEAQLAAERAAEIMEEHGLEIAALELGGGEGEARDRGNAEVAGLAREEWAEKLMQAVAESCFVNARAMYEHHGYRSRPRMKGFSLIGRRSAVVSCQMLYEYLSRTVIRLSRAEMGSQRYFRFGCAERLAERVRARHEERLREQRREAERAKAEAAERAAASGGGGQSLVVVLEDYAQRERDLNEDFRRGVTPGTTLREREEREARSRAQDAAIRELCDAGESWDVAWWMVMYKLSREEAVKREERYAKQQSRESRSRSYFDREEHRRMSSSYQAGRRAGDAVGLDKQVDKKR